MALRKQPDLLPALEDSFTRIDPEIAPPGTSSVSIADPADQPILDAAISAEVDVLVSGDKHFLSLALARPSIVTARAFLDGYADRCRLTRPGFVSERNGPVSPCKIILPHKPRFWGHPTGMPGWPDRQRPCSHVRCGRRRDDGRCAARRLRHASR